MITNKINKMAPLKMINKGVATTKNVATKANDYALSTTESMVTNSLEATAQWQTVANKALTGGLKLAANQQDIIFETMNVVKGQFILGKKRFNKLMA